jgi:branched-chain amino acid transport system ATP-binding protein
MSGAHRPVLSIHGLSKSFGALSVVRDVDLDVMPGSRMALIGPNGAGKTTLLNLLAGTLVPDAGTIRLDDHAVERLAEEKRVYRGLVRTHQINALLMETSVRDNVAIAVAERKGVARRALRYRNAWQECVREADDRLGEIDLAAERDSLVAQLPYGKQRLLEIAIALALEPRVLLLDEPGAGVPQAEAHVIHRALERLPANVAILLVEHDMDLVFRFAQEIVVLVEGAVLVRDTPAVVAADPRVRSTYLGQSAA